MQIDEINIDKKFSDRLPPLTKDEYATLKQNIMSEGRVRDSVCVWKEKGICVDGHHRTQITAELRAAGHEIEFPEPVLISFKTKEDAFHWMDENARGQRNLTDAWKKILIGRKYNGTKKCKGQPKKQSAKVMGQPDPLLSEPTRDRIATEEGVSPKSVVRNGQRAKVYDVVEQHFGRDSKEARAAMTAKQAVIELIAQTDLSDAETIVDEIKSVSEKEKRSAKRKQTASKKQTLFDDTKTPFQEMLRKAKQLGRADAKKFWKTIGAETTCKKFRQIVAEIHYIHIMEHDDGTVEVFVDEVERDLCTAIHKQLERLKQRCERGNKFSFERGPVIKMVGDLMGLVTKASMHK